MKTLTFDFIKYGMFPCLITLLSIPIAANAEYPNCETAQKLLSSRAWKNYESGNTLIYRADGKFSGIRTIQGTKASYKLTDTELSYADNPNISGRSVCEVSFSYLDGDCVGDVDGFFVEFVGNAIQFRTRISAGERVWEARSISTICEGTTNYSISPP